MEEMIKESVNFVDENETNMKTSKTKHPKPGRTQNSFFDSEISQVI